MARNGILRHEELSSNSPIIKKSGSTLLENSSGLRCLLAIQIAYMVLSHEPKTVYGTYIL